MTEDQKYESLLTVSLALMEGQNSTTERLKRMTAVITKTQLLASELVEESQAQEKRYQEMVDILRSMGDTSVETQKRLAALESAVADLQQRAS